MITEALKQRYKTFLEHTLNNKQLKNIHSWIATFEGDLEMCENDSLEISKSHTKDKIPALFFFDKEIIENETEENFEIIYK